MAKDTLLFVIVSMILIEYTRDECLFITQCVIEFALSKFPFTYAPNENYCSIMHQAFFNVGKAFLSK